MILPPPPASVKGHGTGESSRRTHRPLAVWLLAVAVTAGCASSRPGTESAAHPGTQAPQPVPTTTIATDTTLQADGTVLQGVPSTSTAATDTLTHPGTRGFTADTSHAAEAGVAFTDTAAGDTTLTSPRRTIKAWGQQPGRVASPFGVRPADTTGTPSTLEGSVYDTTAADTLPKPPSKKSDIDTSIAYGGEQIRFDVPKKTSIITGRAHIEYKDMTLSAHKIVVDWENNLMTATPEADTLWADSAHTTVDSITYNDMPTFNQGGQTMSGMLMRVNIKTKEGYVEDGRTKYGDGYYRGNDIEKVSDKVLYVQNGAYTTCDLEHPHYKFTGSQMKMIYKKEVVGKPVVLRFGDVPVFALPFGVFSTKPGRHSGILVPTYGDDSQRGRSLRNLGYYWAASQYWDLKTTLDFYEKSGILLRSDLNYKVRNKLNGGISGSFNNSNITSGHRAPANWDMVIRHNQDIDQNTRLRVNANFVSGSKFYQEFSNNPLQRLNQKLESNATLTRSWPNSGASMSLNLREQQNLATGENSQTLPNLSFRFGSHTLFPTASKRRSQDKSLIYEPPKPRRDRNAPPEEEEEEHWYNSITYRYDNQLRNERTENLVNRGNLEGPKNVTYKSGITHNFSLNAPQKLLRYISLTPNVAYHESWFNERRHWYLDGNGTPKSTQERGFFQRRTFSASMTGNTKLYGYFNLNRASIKTIRHVLTPQVSFTYQPDFSTPKWGYYQQLQKTYSDTLDSLGNVDYTLVKGRYDRYSGSIFGGTPAQKRLSLSASLNNLFQMKRTKLNDKGEEEDVKTDLFTYNLRTSFNFAADSMNFSPLSASFRANPISGKNRIGPLERLSIDISTTHSFYQFSHEAGHEVNKFYWSEPGHGLNVLRMTNFSTSSSFSLSGRSPFARRKKTAAEADTTAADSLPSVAGELDDRFSDPTERAMAGVGSDKPWSVSGSLRYNLQMSNPIKPLETIRMNGTITLQLTRNWKFDYTTMVDLQTHQVVSSGLSVYRDLHCWEGRFTWNPQGLWQGFYLRIGIKASQLRDIKFEQRRGRGAPNSYY